MICCGHPDGQIYCHPVVAAHNHPVHSTNAMIVGGDTHDVIAHTQHVLVLSRVLRTAQQHILNVVIRCLPSTDAMLLAVLHTHRQCRCTDSCPPPEHSAIVLLLLMPMHITY